VFLARALTVLQCLRDEDRPQRLAREPARDESVTSKDERVDAVGSCVGHRGARVQAVVTELFDEKIDIVRWSADNRQLITEALSPARVSSVQLNEDTKSAFVAVSPAQDASSAISTLR
jgi:N utilization substance protein A